MGGVVGRGSPQKSGVWGYTEFMYLWAIQIEMWSRPLDEQVWSSEERLTRLQVQSREIHTRFRGLDIDLEDVCI